MQILVGKTENEWVHLAWTWLHTQVLPEQRVFIPAGGTPTPLYRRLCNEPTGLWSSLTLLQLDEVMSGPKKGQFRRFFEDELAPFIGQMEWITNADRIADAAILGVGINGHVAFHEPQLPRGFTGGCVKLSEETMRYLELEDPTWGLTYGVATFVRSKRILVLARGEAKRKVILRALEQGNLPVSWILEHPGTTLLTDFSI